MQESGPKFGYFPNAVKTHLLVKPEKYEEAKVVFGDTAIQLSCEGKCYLGGAIGTDEYVKRFFRSKVEHGSKKLKRLLCLPGLSLMPFMLQQHAVLSVAGPMLYGYRLFHQMNH